MNWIFQEKAEAKDDKKENDDKKEDKDKVSHRAIDI